MAMLAGRLIGSAAVMVAYRRSPPLKIVFNLSLLVSEICLALTIFRALAPATPVAGPATWLAAYAAAFAADVMGVVAISCVIAARDGAVDLRALFSGAGSLKVPAMAVTLGLVCVVSLAGMRESAWLLLGFGVLLLLAFRTYASLAERHLNLERLYRFSQAVSSSVELDDVMNNVLGEAKEVLRSDRATAAFIGPDGELVARVRLDAAGRLSRSEEPSTPEDDLGAAPGHRRGEAAAHAPAHPGARGAALAGAVRDARRRRRPAQRARPASSERSSSPTGSATSGPSRTTTPCCSRPSPTTPASRCATASSSASCATTPCTTRSPGCPTGRTCSAGSPPRSPRWPRARRPAPRSCMLDLDGFKQVNETFGHQQGDRLLMEVALRLEGVVGATGTVARLGGDEFAVLVPGTVDEDRAVHLARRLLRALEQPRRARRDDGARSAPPSAWRSRPPTPPTRRPCSSGPTWRCPTPRPPPGGSGSTTPSWTPTSRTT